MLWLHDDRIGALQVAPDGQTQPLMVGRRTFPTTLIPAPPGSGARHCLRATQRLVCGQLQDDAEAMAAQILRVS